METTYQRLTVSREDGGTMTLPMIVDENFRAFQLNVISMGGKVLKSEPLDETTYYKEFLDLTVLKAQEATFEVVVFEDNPLAQTLSHALCSEVLRRSIEICKRLLKEISEKKLNVEITEDMRMLAEGKIDPTKAMLRGIDRLLS